MSVTKRVESWPCQYCSDAQKSIWRPNNAILIPLNPRDQRRISHDPPVSWRLKAPSPRGVAPHQKNDEVHWAWLGRELLLSSAPVSVDSQSHAGPQDPLPAMPGEPYYCSLVPCLSHICVLSCEDGHLIKEMTSSYSTSCLIVWCAPNRLANGELKECIVLSCYPMDSQCEELFVKSSQRLLCAEEPSPMNPWGSYKSYPWC